MARQTDQTLDRPVFDVPPRVALVVAPFYRDIADLLIAGATAEVEAAGGSVEVIEVPGALEIPPAVRLAWIGGDFDGFVAHRHRQVPMGRMGSAWDVANATLFLCSDEARYVTAQEIVVDGGITAATR